MFGVGEFVVYPAQGVGRVERIETQEIGGVPTELIIVRILSNNVTLMVPVKNAANVGLREVYSAEQAEAIFDFLRDRSDFTGYMGQNWNRRYREYSEKLKSSVLQDVAYVLKELILISKDKELSFGERRLLEQAMNLVSLELAFALGKEQSEIKRTIEELFADILQAGKDDPAEDDEAAD